MEVVVPLDDLTEAERLAALHRLGVLDTPPEAVFDHIVATAAQVCGVPIALMSLVDESRQWFKANVGLSSVGETPRQLFAFCADAIGADTLFEVPDASLDARFAANPLVTGEPAIRFYAGAPIVLPGGERVGTVCVIDRKPRVLDAHQRQALEGLSRIASAQLIERQRHQRSTNDLAESEARYRAIVEDQTELISLTTPDGTIGYVNAAYARAFGSTSKQMIGRNLIEFVDEADRAGVQAHLQSVIALGTTATGVNRMIAADGSTRWVEWMNRPMSDVRGRVVSMHSVGRDVTEQRRAELALAESEQRFRRLYESTPALLHSIDAQGRLLSVTDRWLATLGYQRAEVIGRFSSEFLTPASQRYAREVVLPAFFANGRCDRVEYQFMHRDGHVIDMLLSATLERDGAGAPARSLAVLEDISERKRLAAELGRASADLDAIVDNVPAMLGYWDKDGVNRFANRAYQAAVGIPIDRLVGQPVKDVYEAVDSAGFAQVEPRIRAALAGKRQEFEQSLLTVAGLRQLQVTYVPDRLADGSPAGYYELAYDITGQKALELRLGESEQRYRALFDNLNSGFALHEIIVDRDGKAVDYRFLIVNEAFSRITGIEASACLGKRVTEVLPGIERDPADWIGLLGHVALTGETAHFEQYSAPLKRWYEVVAYRPQAGQFAAVVQDVTDRRQAEAERRLSEQRLRLLVDAVHEYSMILLDAEGRVQTWNIGAQRLEGYAAEEIIGQHCRYVFTGDEAQRGVPEQALRDAAAHGHHATEGWRVRKDGSRFWAAVELNAIRDANGELQGFAKVTHDLTERRRQQDMLLRVAELSPSAMLLIDDCGVVQFVNARTEAIFGYTREELVGQPLDLLLPPELRSGHELLRDTQVSGTAPDSLGIDEEVRGRRKDGSEFDVEIDLCGLETPDGVATLAAVVDVTERRKQSASLRAALREKETLLKEVYHRVKNNLQVVQSLLSLQRGNMPEGAARTAMEESVQRVRAMALVHEKLYQSGSLASVALADYTADLLRQLGEVAGASQRGVKLRADIAALHTGLDNAIPYGLLVTELVSNSLKHGFAGRSTGEILVTLSTQGDGHPLLLVCDDGIGVPAGFELGRTTSMGMQLAASLARQLGGELIVRNQNGAVFSARLSRL